jgi:hypothetical protein
VADRLWRNSELLIVIGCMVVAVLVSLVRPGG